MLVYAVDLGTTNVKVVLFDERLHRLAAATAAAVYARSGDRVEFDPEQLFGTVVELMHRCAAMHGRTAGHHAVIVVTGQAESLVLADLDGRPVRPGMSWMDERAMDQAATLREEFGAEAAFAITGEPEPTATWPAAKLRWLAEHDPAALRDTASVLLVKDDLIMRLTGARVGERTTRGFTYFYDVVRGRYWSDMLAFCGVDAGVLPELVEPGTEAGAVREEVAALLPDAAGYRVNVGALDHFCSMAGTGSYRAGSVSESSGTVLSVSMLAADWAFDPGRRVSFHAGLRPDEIVLFNAADTGGVALDWYRREGLGGMPFDELERALTERSHAGAPLFLPYLTGVNAPDFFPHARGAFLELDLAHDRIDMAYAVEEGLAHLLRRNIDALRPDGTVTEIVSTGGGSASAFWSRLKADVCGVDVVVPHEQEATCRGAAALALVAAGAVDDLDAAAGLEPPAADRHRPADDGTRAARSIRFDHYLTLLFQH